jgi:beta-glucosidase
VSERPSHGFLWGTATSAYQVEGAVDEGGRGRSIWDEFSERPGAVVDGQSGRVACDHYHRWKEDLNLMRELGIQAHRFSIAWPRVFPEGTGRVNDRGLDFYSRLVDGLLERGMEPMATLYHWDLPLALGEAGGWLSRETAHAFAEYVRVVAERLGDRIRLWATLNEIPVIVNEGYRDGTHPPGERCEAQVINQVRHHLLLAHGLGTQALRAAAPARPSVGLVDCPHVPEPLTESEGDIAAAREAFERMNGMRFDPIFRGCYPAAWWEAQGESTPEVMDGDLATIQQPQDFLGLNVYSSWNVASAERGVCQLETHFPQTDLQWPIMPDCLYWATRFAHEVHGPPAIFITESGCAYPDQVNERGEVDDFARIAYLRGHLRGVDRAVAEGFPLRGYFLWSFLDNFEWAKGYAKRFGIVHVNNATLKRTPKASARWYAQHIATHSSRDATGQ